jgi:GNAT superfamily N-acetyltransferase
MKRPGIVYRWRVVSTIIDRNLFVSASMARRIERAEASLVEEGVAAVAARGGDRGIFAHRLNGGVAAFTDDGSPFNKVAGLGFDGVPSGDELDRIEAEFAQRHAPVQFEISTLADPDLCRTLTRRGYELVGFENVLGRPLAPLEAAVGPEASIHISPVAPHENAVWLDAVVTGFLQPDTFDGPASHESFDRAALERVYTDTFRAPGFERLLARRGGEVAGGASVRVFEGIAQLCGAATLPAHRRQGVQSALLQHRLDMAASRGCDLAVVTTQPGSKSQQNVQRFGFSLLYARAVLIKPAPSGS